jgi:hypothetical protein
LSEEILKIGRRCAGLPVEDARPDDEIIGYDGHELARSGETPRILAATDLR